MGFLDRAKVAAQRAKSQARVAREQGQQRFEDLQARRQAEILLRDVGIAAYEEHRGEGDHEAVVRALARLDRHLRNHPSDLSTGGLRGYVRTAAGADGEAVPPDASSGQTRPAEPQQPPTEPESAADAPAEDAPEDALAEEPSTKKTAKKTAKKAAKKAAAKKASQGEKTAAKKTAKKATKKTAPSEKPQPSE